MSREHLLKKPVKNIFHRSLLLCLLSFFVFSLVSLYYGSEVYAGQATLSWVAPSINEDGTPLTDLAGYKIYYGTASGNYTQNVNAGNVTTYAFTNLIDGKTFYFVATAYNAAKFESKYSNEISKTIPALTQTYILSVNKAGTGSVSSAPSGITCGADCSESYNSGTSVNLTASPDTSSTFTGWSGACTGTGSCSVTMNAAKSVTATFALKTYAITASASTGGSISPMGSVSVNHGASQSFNITANSGYSIANVLVDGASVGAVASYTFSNVTSNHTISVSFTAVQQNSLNVTKAGSGSGIVTSSPAGINCGSDCTESYTAGAVVTLTVTPDSSSTFTGWSGACTGSGTCSVTMDGAKNVTATFNLKTYSITASSGNGGSISPSGTVSVNYGSSQSFTITPDANYTIGNVVVDGSNAGSVTSYNFANVTANHTISASFTAVQQNSLNVTKAGSGSGIVTSSPAGIYCGSDCTESYTAGAVVTLTVTPDSSSSFGGWSGACSGTGTCSVTMDAAKSVSPLFQANSLTIIATASNGGSISPSGTVTVNNGGSQSFTITPDANYTIGNVVVDGVSAGSVTTYNFANVTANHIISASFTAIQQNSLNVTKAGSGTGVVTSSPAGINCGSDCTEVYTAGTVVTLTATPDSNATFGGWSGACTDNGTCTLTMDAAKSVSPLFQANSLTIIATASNGGSISPSGTVTVNYDGSQSFTITPDANYTVGNVVVDGVSAGSVASYSFTNVNGNHTISVSFTQNDDTTNSVTTIPKTGQTLIYASGDDGNIQAGVEWPAQRFTDNGDGTVTDSLTGLMWLKDGGCMKAKWISALTTVAGLNNYQGQSNCAGYAGNYSDWRLPTVNELKSLVNYGAPDSAQWLNSEGFVNMKSTYYWSATSYLGTATKAWMITLINGVEKIGSSNTSYILPVRIVASTLPKAGQAVIYNPADQAYIQEKIEWPAPRYTDNGDGTVTDSLTGLMWLKDGGCLKKRWSDALNIIGDFNANSFRYSCLGYTANYNDWRMPNVKELESMINYEASDAVGWLNSAGFTNVRYSSYWSSTTSQKSVAQAWMMNMKKSGKLLQNKKSNHYAWPVRGGNVDKE